MLNSLLCLNLCEKPELKCSVGFQTHEHGLSRLVFVGASHAGKMATLLGLIDQVVYLSLPAQTAPKPSVESIAEKLLNMQLTKQEALIVVIFSSSILMGSDKMGMPVPAFQLEPGRYHISGCLEIAPEGFLKKCLGAVRPILEAAVDAVKVCLLPIARFVKRPCCKDGGHITNFMVGGQPPLCGCHMQEHCLQRGRESRTVAIHLRSYGSLWRWNQAGRKDELRGPQCMAGG